MYSVTKTIEFCYGHRLLNYQGKCRHLHGHNGTVEIELSSEHLDRRGMVRDFNEMKHVLQGWIDRELDHKMLLNTQDPALPFLRRLGEPVCVLDTNPTAESIARLIFEYAASQRFPVTAVRLREAEGSVATYRLKAAATGRRPGPPPPGRGARPSTGLGTHPERGQRPRRRARRRAARRSTSTAA